MTRVEKPELAVNRGQQTVAGALNGFIAHAATGFVGGACLDVATAYFNVGGYSLLADALDQVTGVRLLLGAEPAPPESRRRALRSKSANPQRAARARLRRALEGHEQNLLVERDHLGFTFEVDATTRRLVKWLRSENVEVRRLEGRFLHGKAFLVGDRSHGVVAGSSNFTYAGLATNLELNLGNYSPHVVGQVQDWFEELWDEADEYAMVVIDEAHNLRNPGTQRAHALRQLLAGAPPKKLVMLTATPVNNSLWDLYHLLGYFLRNDAVFADAGIRSLRDHFATAMALNPDDLTPEHLFDVLDAVAVRRTRAFVKRFYPNDTIKVGGQDQQIVFPTPRVHKVDYNLDEVMPGFFYRFAHALDPDVGVDDPGVLTMARYSPSQFRLDHAEDAYEKQLVGLLRSGLLKRFESSPFAFAETCERMATSHDAFLSLLDNGRVATGEALADWIATDSDEMDEEQVDTFLDDIVGVSEDAAQYEVDRLRVYVDRDRGLLRSFAAEARTITQSDDPNLAALVDELADIAAEAETQGIGDDDVGNRRKVLIFSYFADTVDWVYEHLVEMTATDERLAPYRDRIASLSGTTGTESKESVLWGFAPLTTDAPAGADDDRFDIVVTTDVLAEGVNLQQARHIINYDLPWNPMRLVQRHGRIDRIGSHHTEVFLRCVFPDDRLDDLLGLEERLHRKIAQAAASIGVGDVLPNQAAQADINFTETREEIERLRNENPELFERGGTARGALSGEQFRQELRQALEDTDLADQIKSLPWGSGSGMAVSSPDGRPGYVFCARVGDHPRPIFRFVETDTDAAVIDETLACLDKARPPAGFDTPRQLDDATIHGAFTAWETARAHIVDQWNFMSDPANLQPKVAPRLHRAAEILRKHPPLDLTQDEIDRAIDTINAPYPERTIRTFQAAITSTDDPTQQAQNILTVIQTLGLEPYIPPDPLPEIRTEDVHLITWLALT